MTKERYDELVELLNKANYEYYVLSNPSITDQEFDKYIRELYWFLSPVTSCFILGYACCCTRGSGESGDRFAEER